MEIYIEVDLNNSTDLYTYEVKIQVNLKVNLNLNLKDLKWHLLSGLFQKEKIKLNTMLTQQKKKIQKLKVVLERKIV